MIPVDSTRFQPVATGNVSAVSEWTEVDGKRKRSDVQAVHPETRLPLWNIEILRKVREFGEEKTTAVMVEVGARSLPEVHSFAPIALKNLNVEFYVNRSGKLAERWSAEELHSKETLNSLMNEMNEEVNAKNENKAK